LEGLYPPGALLVQQGGAPREIFIIDQGLVKLCRVQPGGKESIVGIRSAGEVIAAASAILGCPHPVDAITVTACRLSRMDHRDFVRRLQADRAFSWHLHEMHSRDVCGDFDHLAELGCEAAGARLRRLLLKLASAFGSATACGGVAVTLPLRQWEIAQLIAVTPQYLCQLLGEFECSGVLSRQGSTMVLHAETGTRALRLQEVEDSVSAGAATVEEPRRASRAPSRDQASRPISRSRLI